MSELVPVQRADRNGKMVTRWVKPSNATQKRSPDTHLVPKVKATAHKPNRRAERIAKQIAEQCYSSQDQRIVNRFYDDLERYDPTILKDVELFIQKDPYSRAYQMNFLMEHFNERELRDIITYYERLHPDSELDDFQPILKMVRGLSRFKDQNLSELDGEDRKIIEASVKIVSNVSTMNPGRQYVALNDELQEIIAGNLDRVDEIEEFIQEREEDNWSVLKEYLSENSPLRKGFL